MKVAVIIARVLLGLTFVVFGLNGFLQFIPVKQMPTGLALQFLTVLMQSHWVWVVSAVQLVGGLFVLVNRYAILGLALLGPVIFNILTYHALLQPSMAQPAILVTILWLFVAYHFRQHFACLFAARAD